MFEDDGHYTDIHFNVVVGGGAARIQTWRQSFIDPGHYNYLEFPTVEQRQRSSRPSGYEGLNPADLASVHQAPAPGHYTGIGGSRRDPHGYLEPVEVQVGSGNNSSIAEHEHPLQQPGPHGLSGMVPLEAERHDAVQQGQEGLDSSVVEQLRRTTRRHSYAGIGTDRSAVHSYLEVIGYLGTDSGQNGDEVTAATAKDYQGLDRAAVEKLRAITRRPHSYAGIEVRSSADRSGVGHSGTDREGDGGRACKGYEGLDPAEVEELRRRATTPHDYAGLAASDRGTRQGEVVVTAGPGYEGLDPVEVEQFRQRAMQPQEYAGLRDNVEDLYSHPMKKR